MALFGSDDLEMQWELYGNASDYDEPSDDDDGQLDLNTDLIGVNRTTRHLNIVDDWKPYWTCKEAFRESYQNWRDGILRSFNLSLSQFHPTYTENEKKRIILIEARHPETKDLLGFIQFKYDKDGYCVGGLKIVNFKATLKYRNLGTGATTKADDDGQTGQHGDGMKISTLVYRRNNYSVCYESGRFKWRFLYKKGSLVCSLTRINETSLEKMKTKAKGHPRTHNPHPWEDVCLIVGARGPTRDIYGRRILGKRPKVKDFRRWMAVTLDINPPQDIIRTIHGDLIRDTRYKGHMYLRGLRLSRGGTQGTNYAYGYNFVEGSTNSDREALAGVGEESEGISAIWTAAIRTDKSAGSELLSDYTKLLLTSINKKGDVMMNVEEGEDELLPGDIAREVWAKMLTLNTDEEGRKAFYYSAAEGTDQIQIIKESLRKNPIPVDPELWRILNKYFLCKTPKDELLDRFKSAEVVNGLDGSFASYMQQMLSCLLLSSPATQHMKLSFVKGKHLAIDAGFFAGTWKVHNKWLTWEGTHEQTFCEEDQSSGRELFSCDHAVLQLWDIMISQLMADGEHPQVVADERWLKRMARSRLSQMPRSVECFPTGKMGELMVTWESIDSHRNKHKTVNVTLHWVECEEENNASDRNYIHRGDRLCSCPHAMSLAVSSGVTFTGLNTGFEYLPSVSRDVEGALIAPRPKPTKPPKDDDVVSQVTETVSDSVLPSVETGSHSAAADPIKPRSNYRPPHISDDDEEEDNGSLYQPPSISPHPSVPVAPSIPPAPPSPKPPSVRRKPIRVNLTKQPKEDSYALGAKIEHKSLDWGGSFPGSHDFYRTRNEPEKEIYILKPKVSTKKSRHKRVQSGAKERSSAKKSRTGTVADQAAPPAYIVLSSPEPSENDGDSVIPEENPAGRSGLSDITPLPERGIVYRY